MGSVPVYTTSSADNSAPQAGLVGRAVARPSRALVLTSATPIVMRPEEGSVVIGNQTLPAFQIVEADGLDADQDGFLGRFTVQGKRWTYIVEVFTDRVEVQKWHAEIDDDRPIYGGDVSGYTRAGACARFMIEELIPDCLAALEAESV